MIISPTRVLSKTVTLINNMLKQTLFFTLFKGDLPDHFPNFLSSEILTKSCERKSKDYYFGNSND